MSCIILDNFVRHYMKIGDLVYNRTSFEGPPHSPQNMLSQDRWPLLTGCYIKKVGTGKNSWSFKTNGLS